MCFNISIARQKKYIEKQFNAHFVKPEEFKKAYHVSAFKTPFHPVITSDDPDQIKLFQWGLIPFWAENIETANKIKYQTLNARSETIFNKPSFKYSINKRRCLIIVDGFFEYRDQNRIKYPYYIRFKNKQLFALAGIWDSWSAKNKDQTIETFSIITTRANPLLSKIHNIKKRMPVILLDENQKDWLDLKLTKNRIKDLLKPYQGNDLEAYPVSRLISKRGAETNRPDVIEPFEYEELEPII